MLACGAMAARVYLKTHWAARAVRKHAADLGRCQRSRGLRAAAAGCRRRQEYNGRGACECGFGVRGIVELWWRWIGV